MAKATAIVGVSDHWGYAVLITVDPDGGVVDRRRVELVDDGLPPFPYHHDALRLPRDAGVALVERVRASAARCARRELAALAATVAMPIAAIALRVCPDLPPTIAERLADYRAQNVADSVMYRVALAEAALWRLWSVGFFEAKGVPMGDPRILAAGKRLGPPWQRDHRLAMAAAIRLLVSGANLR